MPSRVTLRRSVATRRPRRNALLLTVIVCVTLLSGTWTVHVGRSAQAAASQAPTVVYVPPGIDPTGSVDVSSAISSFFASTPDGVTVRFQPNAIYRLDATIELSGRQGLTIDGNGSTMRTSATGDAQRSHWRFWGGSGITIQNMSIIGPNSSGAFTADVQWQHGIDLRGVRGFEATGVSIEGVYGDCFYLSVNDDGAWSKDVVIHDSTCSSAGRQGVALAAAQDVVIERNTFAHAGLNTIVIEPNRSADGVVGVRIAENRIGASSLKALGITGPGLVSDVRFEGNELVGKPMAIAVAPTAGTRRSGLTIAQNTSDSPAFGDGGAAMIVEDVDGLVVIGNTVPLSGPNRSVVDATKSCRLEINGNVFPGGVVEYRSFEAPVCVAPAPNRPASRFVALTPARILDTRTHAAPKPGPGAVVDLQVTGQGGVPATGVTAVVMNVTATEATADGFVTVWPTGEPMPLASNLNARPEPRAPVGEQAVPNLVTVPVSVVGKVSLFTQSGAHLLADVAGYYEAVPLSAEGRLVPLPEPTRVLDTRPQTGQVGYTGGKPGPGDNIDVTIAGRAGVPASGASAVVLNVTATEATERGFVTVFPGGSPLPWASNLNVEYAGQTVPNQVMVPLGPDGSISLYTQSGTHLVADVAGWFTGPANPLDTTGLFVPVSPERHLDTRTAGSPVAAGGTVTVAIVSGQIPATGVGAVTANVTATAATAPGFVTAYPTGSRLPWASNLNIDRAGQTISNHVTVGVPANGFSLYTLSGSHLVADVFGWYMS